MDFDARAHVREATLNAFNFRRATKAFDPSKPIDPADFDVILQAARLSPTSNGLEPFNLLVLDSAAVRQRIVDEAGGGPQWVQAPKLVVITTKRGAGLHADGEHITHMKLDVQGFPADDLPGWQEHFEYFLTKNLELDNDKLRLEWARRQAYIVLGNIMTAAALLSIDSCALEGVNYAVVDGILDQEGLQDKVKDQFAVAVALGYRAAEPKRERTRRPLEEIVRYA
ncbi:MAG: NAD(P)H-dependent oxidoreductase [Propionibacteriaceae bacterium]|jgi:nitroreductase|nr:NAD(P)H-dependent oxidoreductase [Propionibacteriaceae bacterium]